MTTVGLVYTLPPPAWATDTAEQIRAAGYRVVVAGPKLVGWDRLARHADAFAPIRHRAAPVPIDRDHPPQRWSREWSWVVARNVWRKRSQKPLQAVLSAPTLWWRTLSQDQLAMAQLRTADVLGALDPPAVYSVWRLARINPDAAAISGVQPVLEHLGLAR
jgi:hypothetical protein